MDTSLKSKSDSLVLAELINIHELQKLFELQYKIAKIPVGLLDIHNNILVGVGWQDICVNFHRANPETEKLCKDSDSYIARNLVQDQYVGYKCRMGLWDFGVPVKIAGQHLGNLMFGQFLYDDDPENMDYFIRQAEQYNFNQKEYLEALKKVPRFSREKVKEVMDYYAKLVDFITEQAHQKLLLQVEIDHRKKLEESLMESKSEYKTLILNIPQKIFYKDLQLNYIICNDAFARDLGIDKDQIKGKSDYDFFEPEVAKKYRADDEFVLKSNQTVEFDETYTINGKTYTVHTVKVPVKNDEGNTIGLYGIFWDITENVRKAEELEKQRTFLNSIYAGADLPMFVIAVGDKNHLVFEGINAAHERVTGMKNEEVEGKTPEQLPGIPDEAKKAVRNNYENCLKAGKPIQYQEMIPINGKETHWLTTLTPLKNDQGQIYRIVGTAMFINQMIEIQQELELHKSKLELLVEERTKSVVESEERFKAIFESSSDCIMVWDRNYKNRFANQATLDLFGITDKNIADKNIEASLSTSSPEFIKLWKSRIDQLFKSGKSFRVEDENMINGKTVYSESVVSPILDSENQIVAAGVVFRDVTKRKTEALKQKETNEKYKLITEATNHGIWDWDLNTNAVYYSPKWKHQIGYKDAELRNEFQVWEDHLHPDDYDRCMSELNAFMQKPTDKFVLEFRFRHKNGHYVWIHNEAATKKDKNGKVVRFYGVHTDITEEKIAKEALKNSEQKYKTLTESSRDIIFNIDTNHRIVYLNQQAARPFQVRPEELTGKHVNDIFPPDIAASQINSINKVIQSGEPFSTVSKSVLPHGMVWLDTTLTPLKDEQGKVVSVMGVSRDVSAAKRVEMEIRKSENRLSSLIHTSSSIVWQTAGNGAVTSYQPGWGAFTGQSFDEMKDWGWLSAIHPDDQEKTAIRWQESVNNKSFYQVEHRLKKHDGTYRHFSVKGVPILDENGNIEEWIGTHTDITEAINAQEEIKTFKTAVDSSPEQIYIIDPQKMIFIDVNATACTQLNYSREELLQMGPHDIKPFFTKKLLSKTLNGILDSNKEGIIETIHQTKDQLNFPVEILIKPFISRGKKLLVAVARDISERRKAEAALIQSENNLKTLLHSMPFGSVIIGEDRKVRSVNQTALQMMGYATAEEVIGSTCFQTFCPACNDNCPVWDLHQQIDKEDKILITKNQEKIPILKSAVEVVLDNEKVLLETFIDISEIKKLEKDKETALLNLNERIKEMSCLYKINQQFRSNHKTLEDILQQSVNIIPEGFQYPENTIARITIDNIKVKSPGKINEFGNFLKEEIVINNSSRGFVSVYGHGPHNHQTGVVFLDEEKALLKEIASNIGQYIDKTEHEQALIMSEAKFRQLIQDSPLLKVVTDLEGNIEFSNNSFQTIIGYTNDDMKTVEEWWSLAYPDEEYRLNIKQLWEKEMELAMQNNSPTAPIEARVKCKDGTTRIFDVIGSRIGEKIMVVFTDLTARIEAEEERDRFFTVSLDLLCIAGTDGYFKRLNPSWENKLGWSSTELKEKPFIEFVHPDDVAATLKEVEKLSQGSPTISFTNRYRCKDGSYRWLNWNTTPFGDILYAAATDITALVEAQEKVDELNQRLNIALEGGGIGIWEWNLQSNALIWDNRMEEIFGVPANSFEGNYEGFRKRLHPEDIAPTEMAIEKALKDEAKFNEIYRVIVNRDQIRHINGKAVVIKNNKAENQKMIGVCMDVSDLKNTQNELLQTADELKRSNHELEQFAYVASHDLQQPLRMISSYTQLLEKRYKDQIDEKANKYIHYAVDGANRMQGLINDLLSYSRVTTMGETFKETDLNDVVKEVLNNLEVKIAESRTSITINKLPVVNCDASQVGRVFQNLIDNAMKFTKNNTPKIEVGAKRKNNLWILSVKDNGIGIDPKYHDKVFVIFQRLHLRDDYPGTGIGLSICKRIINRHGGEVWFESQPNKGTTFFFSIPIKSKN